MEGKDTSINPKPIISLMFAISVGFWASQLAQHPAFANTGNSKWINEITPEECLTLVSGVLFLLDLLCIVWWYAKYIYRVQPKVSFGAYFLDFVICSMFALAANSWTQPTIFLLATLLASGLLFWRFVGLYYCESASMMDRYIISKARVALLFALAVASISLAMADRFASNSGINVFKYSIPGVLSLIGVVLTLYLWKKIDVAVAIYVAKHGINTPTYLSWPALETSDIKEEVKRQRTLIRQQTNKGLERFDNLFSQIGKYDRIHSRVHSDTELRVQSYILGLPSCVEQDHAEEIEKKAFMVATSHWLDDLVDGRNEIMIWKQLQNSPSLSDNQEQAEKLFQQIYQRIIIKHTDRQFYNQLYEQICASCTFKFNRKYMFLGLNRIAYGSIIFSPKISYSQRVETLDKHNVFLKEWNDEDKGDFEKEAENILDEIAGSGEAGSILLGLTTKTVQEVAFSSENHEMDISLSILFSILYAPLIYYHNIVQELQNDEMIPLQAFDTDFDVWVPWLRRTRKAINTFENGDGRQQMRLKQIEMAYKCFEPLLPSPIAAEICDVYLQKPEDVRPV